MTASMPAGQAPTATSVRLSPAAQNFAWLLDSFCTRTAGVDHAFCVSSDGLLMAAAGQVDRTIAERMAAVTSGLLSLADGAARTYEFGGVRQVVVEMNAGMLLISSISDGSLLGVIADKSGNMGTIGYEMAVFVERAGAQLTPDLVTELKAAVTS